MNASTAMTIPRNSWRRALRALRTLIRDPDQTDQAFVFLQVAGSRNDERVYRRFLADPRGARLVAERPSLARALSDRAVLASLPPGSFGRAYLDHVERNGFDPVGLSELRKQAFLADFPPLDPVHDWMHDRGVLTHDLWHVLSGYGADEIGEATLLWFSFAQLGGSANLLLSVAAALSMWPSVGVGCPLYLYKAWRRGRRAVWLVPVPYEELLARPLDEVRASLAIDAPEHAHPRGILRGKRGNVVGGGDAWMRAAT
jgi:ubiquinone biosynthesis protein COQ4